MDHMSYRIDLQQNIVFGEFRGLVISKYVLELIQEIRNDPDYHKDLNTIFNICEAEIADGFLEINAVAQYLKETIKERSNYKLALLTCKENLKNIALFKALMKSNNIRACLTLEEAIAWVTSS
jgi:hypothetical protein